MHSLFFRHCRQRADLRQAAAVPSLPQSLLALDLPQSSIMSTDPLRELIAAAVRDDVASIDRLVSDGMDPGSCEPEDVEVGDQAVQCHSDDKGVVSDDSSTCRTPHCPCRSGLLVWWWA